MWPFPRFVAALVGLGVWTCGSIQSLPAADPLDAAEKAPSAQTKGIPPRELPTDEELRQFVTEEPVAADNPETLSSHPLVDALERGTRPEIEARLAKSKAERLAAHRMRIATIKSRMEASSSFETLANVLQAQADLAQAELEYDNSPAMRLAAFKTRLIATSRLESEILFRRKIGAEGGGGVAWTHATAARAEAEERFAREILAQRQSKVGPVKIGTNALKGVPPREEQAARTLEIAASPEILKRLDSLKSERLAAIRDRIMFMTQVMNSSEDRNEIPVTLANVMQAQADLARAELEYDSSQRQRLASFKTQLMAALRGEAEIRVKRYLGVEGGGGLEYTQAIAARAQAEELFVREILAQRAQKLQQAEPDAKVLAEFPALPDAIVVSLEQASSAVLNSRLMSLKTERLSALRIGIAFIKSALKASVYDEVRKPVTLAAVLNAHDGLARVELELARAELEYDNSPTQRLSTLKVVLRAAARVEAEIRLKRQLRAEGGGDLEYALAVIARATAEEQLAREILTQRPPSLQCVPENLDTECSSKCRCRSSRRPAGCRWVRCSRRYRNLCQ